VAPNPADAGPGWKNIKHLAAARRHQDQLAGLLRTIPDERSDGWSLRGELLAHVDRLRTELQPARPAAGPADRGDSARPTRVPGRRPPARVRASGRGRS
jgi:hypothetical protein